MAIAGKSPFLIGFTSSNGWVGGFSAVNKKNPPEILFPWKSGDHNFNGHSEQIIIFTKDFFH